MKMTLRKFLYSAQWSFGNFIIDVIFGGHRNIIRQLRAIPFFAFAFISGSFLNKHLGISKWIGCPSAFLLICFVVYLILLARLLVFVPFPSCKNGKCHGIDDYYWFYGSFFGKCKWGVYWYSRRCKDKYLRRGKRFMEFIPEVVEPPSPWMNINKGTTRPYKKLVGFRKWVNDTEPN